MKPLKREIYRTIAIDPEIQRQFNVAVTLEGRTQKDVAEELIRGYLASRQFKFEYLPPPPTPETSTTST